MYISVARSGKDKKNAYVKVMEAYYADGRKKARVIKNLGRLDDLLAQNPHALEELKTLYKEKAEAPKAALHEERLNYVADLLQRSGEAPSALDYVPFPLLQYGHYALRSLWETDLGLAWKLNYLQKTSGPQYQFSLNDAALFMAGLRVMDPHSSLFSFYSKDDFLGDPLRNISLDNCCDTLIFLKENKDKIVSWCSKKLKEKFGTRSASLIFLKAADACLDKPLADEEKDCGQDGFTKRVQPEAGELHSEFWEAGAGICLPSASIALAVDQDGFPMDFEVFSDKGSRFKTMKQAVQKLKDRHPIENAAAASGSGPDPASQPAKTAVCFRMMAACGMQPMDVHTPEHIQGHLTVCLLAVLLLQLLQQRLRAQGTRLSVPEICRSLAEAAIAPIGRVGKDMLFCLTGGGGAAAGGISRNPMPDIMRACGLSPITRMTSLPELAKALHTRFPSPADAISEVRMAALS